MVSNLDSSNRWRHCSVSVLKKARRCPYGCVLAEISSLLANPSTVSMKSIDFKKAAENALTDANPDAAVELLFPPVSERHPQSLRDRNVTDYKKQPRSSLYSRFGTTNSCPVSCPEQILFFENAYVRGRMCVRGWTAPMVLLSLHQKHG